MIKQILMIHGGNVYDSYKEYIKYLKNKRLTLDDLTFVGWKNNLDEKLGKDYEVYHPTMPNSRNSKYEEWKIWFEKIVPLLSDDLILIGHSLGGVFLAKYFSENDSPKKIRATFLIAAPYDEPLGDFKISGSLEKFAKQGGQIFIYQSKNDEVVPYSNAEKYVKALPSAIFRSFETNGHFHQAEFPEIVEDIKLLK